MKKKFFKLLKKQTYTVLLTILFCAFGLHYLYEKGIDYHKHLIEERAMLCADSIRNAVYLEIKEQMIQQEFTNLVEMRNVCQKEREEIKAMEAVLNNKLELVNKKILLEKLIESLRKDYGAIEPGVQLVYDSAYMAKYREHEATYTLAVGLSKELNVYPQYEDFFKNREGIWNLIIASKK